MTAAVTHHPFTTGDLYQGYFCEFATAPDVTCDQHPFAPEHHNVDEHGRVRGILRDPPLPTPPTTAQVYVQWQGTEVCLDFTCTCGSSPHIDREYFAFFVSCPDCQKVWVMPCEMRLRPASAAEVASGLAVIEALEQYDDD